MHETSKILIFPDVSLVSQGSRCRLAVMKESQYVSGQHSITQTQIMSGYKKKISVAVFPWVRLSLTMKQSFQRRPDEHSTLVTKCTHWIRSETFPLSEKLQNTTGESQVCLQS